MLSLWFYLMSICAVPDLTHVEETINEKNLPVNAKKATLVAGLENGIVQELMVIFVDRLFWVLNLIKRIIVARGLFIGTSLWGGGRWTRRSLRMTKMMCKAVCKAEGETYDWCAP